MYYIQVGASELTEPNLFQLNTLFCVRKRP